MNAHPSSISDRELLELAAKAEGTVYKDESIRDYKDGGPVLLRPHAGLNFQWDPLVDNDDAFELAVKLRLDFHYDSEHFGEKEIQTVEVFYNYGPDKMTCKCETQALGADAAAAVRRAIVNAAAEIGRDAQ